MYAALVAGRTAMTAPPSRSTRAMSAEPTMPPPPETRMRWPKKAPPDGASATSARRGDE